MDGALLELRRCGRRERASTLRELAAVMVADWPGLGLAT
jgi:hypothetical protein